MDFLRCVNVIIRKSISPGSDRYDIMKIDMYHSPPNKFISGFLIRYIYIIASILILENVASWKFGHVWTRPEILRHVQTAQTFTSTFTHDQADSDTHTHLERPDPARYS